MGQAAGFYALIAVVGCDHSNIDPPPQNNDTADQPAELIATVVPDENWQAVSFGRQASVLYIDPFTEVLWVSGDGNATRFDIHTLEALDVIPGGMVMGVPGFPTVRFSATQLEQLDALGQVTNTRPHDEPIPGSVVDWVANPDSPVVYAAIVLSDGSAVVQIDTENLMAETIALPGELGSAPWDMTLSTDNGHLLLSGGEVPGVIAIFETEGMTLEQLVTLSSNEPSLDFQEEGWWEGTGLKAEKIASAASYMNGAFYVGTFTNPGRILTFDHGGRRTGEITLPQQINDPTGAATDVSRDRIYWATLTDPTYIVAHPPGALDEYEVFSVGGMASRSRTVASNLYDGHLFYVTEDQDLVSVNIGAVIDDAESGGCSSPAAHFASDFTP